MTKEKELNGKLARFLGWELCNDPEHGVCNFWYYPGGKEETNPDGIGTSFLEFTTSLDCCIKWFIPELPEEHWITLDHPYKQPEMWIVTINIEDADYEGKAEKIALAFCLAMEQYIEEHSNESKR